MDSSLDFHRVGVLLPNRSRAPMLLWKWLEQQVRVALAFSIVHLLTHSFIQDMPHALGSCTHRVSEVASPSGGFPGETDPDRWGKGCMSCLDP